MTGPKSNSDVTAWQWRNRPLMTGMLIGLAIFFFIATLYQLVALQNRAERGPTLDAADLVAHTSCDEASDQSECFRLKRLDMAATLEAHVIARRYHQANVILMSSMWSRYLGFVTGMILALVGAAFILGQLRDQGTRLEGALSGSKATLQSASPGIVLATLGVILMVSTIVTLHQLDTRDAAIYFPGDSPASLPDEVDIYGRPRTGIPPVVPGMPAPSAAKPDANGELQ